MTPLLVGGVLVVCCTLVLSYCLLVSGGRADEIQADYHEQLVALRADAERKRAEREACAVLRGGGDHAA